MNDVRNRRAVSVNGLASPLVEQMVSAPERYRVQVKTLSNGSRVIDAGIDTRGSLQAGLQIAAICLGGLGTVNIRTVPGTRWPLHVDVLTSDPVLACLGSQYAGWSLSHGEGKSGFSALGSGPARAAGSNEPLFAEIGYRDEAETVTLVLEVAVLPPLEIAEKISDKCGVCHDNVTFILTPTWSLAGAVQIVARVLETALHKAHALHFPLTAIIDGAGSAPLCPPAPGFLTAMSRTNDAILFAGCVQLYVDCDDDSAAQLAKQLPSRTSSDYGRPFAEVFKDVNFDFYQIDPMLFSPAQVTVSSIRSGRSFHGGAIDAALLDRSFGSDFG